MEGVLSTNNKLDKKKCLAKDRYQPDDMEKRLKYYKEYYRKRKEEKLGGDLCES